MYDYGFGGRTDVLGSLAACFHRWPFLLSPTTKTTWFDCRLAIIGALETSPTATATNMSPPKGPELELVDATEVRWMKYCS